MNKKWDNCVENMVNWDVQITKFYLSVRSEQKSALRMSIIGHRRESNPVPAPRNNKLFNLTPS